MTKINIVELKEYAKSYAKHLANYNVYPHSISHESYINKQIQKLFQPVKYADYWIFLYQLRDSLIEILENSELGKYHG